MSSSLQESLSKALESGQLVVKPIAHAEAFLVEQRDEGERILIQALNPEDVKKRFHDLEVFFLELRRKVRQLTGSMDWNLRYASQIECMNLPFLHNSSDLTILIDPMLPYRNPVKTLASGESVALFRIPSQVYYAKTKEKVLAIASLQRKPASGLGHNKVRSKQADVGTSRDTNSGTDRPGRPEAAPSDGKIEGTGPSTD